MILPLTELYIWKLKHVQFLVKIITANSCKSVIIEWIVLFSVFELCIYEYSAYALILNIISTLNQTVRKACHNSENYICRVLFKHRCCKVKGKSVNKVATSHVGGLFSSLKKKIRCYVICEIIFAVLSKNNQRTWHPLL